VPNPFERQIGFRKTINKHAALLFVIEPFFPLNPNIQKMYIEASFPLPGIMETHEHIVEDIKLSE
jgi:hypothetical protein